MRHLNIPRMPRLRRQRHAAVASVPPPVSPQLAAADLDSHPSELLTLDPHVTVACEVALSLTAADEALTKLRSWAAISGVSPSGPGVLRVDGELAEVHLPIAEGAAPHAETGLRGASLEGGPARRYTGLRFAALPLIAQYELHAGLKGFTEGTLLVPAAEAGHERSAKRARPAA